MEPSIQDVDCADNHPPEAPPHDTTQPPTEQSPPSDAGEQGDAPPPPPESQSSPPTDPPPPVAHDFASGEQGAVPEGAAPTASDSGHDTEDEDVTPPARPWPSPLDTTSVQSTSTGLASAAPSSSSQSSDHPLGHGSTADPADRVFPIRSVVSVDNSAATPWPRSSGEFEYGGRPESRFRDSRHSSVSRGENDHTAAPGVKRADTMPAPGGERSSSVGGPKPDRANRKSALSGTVSVGSPQPVEHGRGAGGLPMFNDASSVASNDSTTPSENASFRSKRTNSTCPNADSEVNEPLNEDYVTTRFRHVVTKEGHAILTGRDAPLQRCEDEPIHTPGAIQSFGALVALREDADGCFSARIVSENSKRILGYTPQQLFRMGNFLDVFSEDQADNLLDHIDFIRDDEIDPAQNGPEVFSISVRPPQAKKSIKLWCAMHISPTHPDLVICEFELEDDREFPLRPSDNMTPPVPEDTLNQNPTLEEFNESTEVGSKPLRVLRSARKRRGEAGAMQVFDIMSQIQEQLANAPTLEKFLKILVGIVKELTGFHRVMIYQFDAAFNGKVVTELVDPAHTRDLYQGLHFPASDIPKQARDLYKINKVRLLYDRDLESARLVCQTLKDLEEPLDLTHSYLRAMSPIHLKYLKNMAVRASMSVSINAFDELWGLISCHSYGSGGSRVAFPIRKMCRLIGDTASRNIERLSYASRLQARKLINTMPTDQNPSGYIIASSEDLLKLFDADSGVLAIRGETKILGRMDQSQEALALLEYLRVKSFTAVLTTQDITTDLPDLRYPPGFTVLAGMLYVPLSSGGQDFIVFFRKGQVKEVKWAGNPYEKVIKEGTAAYLEPRQSFQVWHETVVGKCREWSEEQVETAAVLCLVYGKFIEVWRQKEAALKSSRLTRLLLANSAHEVRTPLNAIINYLEIALEGSLDQETRDNLAKSHSASKSLIYVINDLLDLTNTEEGLELIKDEILDLPACLQEATEPFKSDAKRKGIGYEVIEHTGLPRWVHGDYRRVRQAVANVTANAVQHTVKGSVKVEYYVAEVSGTKIRLEIVVQDTGRGMTSDQLDALFRAMEQVDTDEPLLEDTKDKKEDKDTEGSEGLSLGLGLAVVARIVRNMDGQMRLKSDPGKGTRFVIQLPFEIPADQVIEDAQGTSTREPSTHSSVPSVTKTMPPSQTGELTLVQSGGSTTNYKAPNALGERRSMDEGDSMGSLRSAASRNSTTSKASARSNASNRSNVSNKSDADRLIDAIQSPLSIGDDNTEAWSARRFSSSFGPSPGGQRASNGLVQQGRPSWRASTDPKTREMSEVQEESGIVHEPGTVPVTGNKTPIRPVKVPDEYSDAPSAPQTDPESGVLFEIPASQSETPQTAPKPAPEGPTKLRVLIAEDDPINMKILRKRLEKAGHTVTHAVNGEDCASVYSEGPDSFDVILMDMQMPIVDGLTSTKMIRAFEKSDRCQALSPLARRLGRTSIFAVSASLVEKERSTYVDAGFDGWILKPIDFKRLHVLLDGIQDDEARDACRYVPGQWERGGWFSRKAEAQASNVPGGGAPDEAPRDDAPLDEPTPEQK